MHLWVMTRRRTLSIKLRLLMRVVDLHLEGLGSDPVRLVGHHHRVRSVVHRWEWGWEWGLLGWVLLHRSLVLVPALVDSAVRHLHLDLEVHPRLGWVARCHLFQVARLSVAHLE